MIKEYIIKEYIRTPTIFEKLLLVVGIVVVIIGYGIIHKLALIDKALSWNMILSIFLWMLVILLIVMTAVTENVKEEVRAVLEREIEKIRLLRMRKKRK